MDRIVVVAEEEARWQAPSSVSPELAWQYRNEQAMTGPETEARIAEYRAAVSRSGRESSEALAIRNEVVRGNLQFIHWVQKGVYVGDDGHWRDDAYQEGTLALMAAVETYDPDAGYRWSTYVTTCLKRSLWGYFSGRGKTRALPGKVQWPLEDCEGRESREQPPTQDVERESLRRALAVLPLRDRRILALHYGLTPEGKLPLHVIGKRLGITKERVRQIEGRALRILRGIL